MDTIALLITGALVVLAPWAALASAAVRGLAPNTSLVDDENANRFFTRSVWIQLLIATIIFGILIGRNAGDALVAAFFAPIFAPILGPLVGVWLSAKYYPFLAVPIIAATAFSIALTILLYRMLPGKARAFVLSIVTVTFVVVFVMAGQFQFRGDVLTAAEGLQPDCLDSRTFVDALSQILRSRFHPYARAIKDGDVYGWSFRTRSFYKIPASVSRFGPPIRNSSFTSRFPHCWQAHPK